MRCEDLHAELSAWIDGELDPEDGARVAAHLHTCPDCSEYVRALQKNSSLVRALRAPRAPASVTATAMRHLNAMSQQAAARSQRRFSFAWPLSAVGVGLVGLAAVLTLAIVAGRQQWLGNPTGNSASFHAEGAASPMPNGAGYHLSSAPDDITGTVPITRGYDFRGTQNRRDVNTFNARERFAWDQGVWRQERRFGRDGWWWDVEGAWYWYDKSAKGPPTIVSDIRFAVDSGPVGPAPQPPEASVPTSQPR